MKPFRAGRQVDAIEIRFSDRSQTALPLGDESMVADATEIIFQIGMKSEIYLFVLEFVKLFNFYNQLPRIHAPASCKKMRLATNPKE